MAASRQGDDGPSQSSEQQPVVASILGVFHFLWRMPVQEVPMAAVNDFDLSDVADGTVSTAETGATGVLKWLVNKWVLNGVTKVIVSIGEGEYRRRVAENDRQRAYGLFIGIMDAVAK